MLGGLNPYGYVHNPLTWVDPLGLAKYQYEGLRPENGYEKGGRHGIKTDPRHTQSIADNDPKGNPYGVWGNKDDLNYAGKMAATLPAGADGGKGPFADFPVNPGTQSKVYIPEASEPVTPDMI